jgi:hypothetical protein
MAGEIAKKKKVSVKRECAKKIPGKVGMQI